MSGSIGKIVGGVGGFLIGGPAGAQIGATLGAGIDSSRASSKASGALQQAGTDATADANREYDRIRADQLGLLQTERADQQPWMDAGKASLAQLASGTAAGGSLVKPFSLADFQADPGYGFRISEGEKGIQRATSARGGLYSGATLKALARFNQDTASQEYGNAYTRYNTDQGNTFSRLMQIAGMGQTATGQVQQAGQSAYGTIASAGANRTGAVQSNILGNGNARASGYVGSANAMSGAVGQAIDTYQGQSYLDELKKKNSLAALARGSAPTTSSPGVYVPESSLPALQMPSLNSFTF